MIRIFAFLTFFTLAASMAAAQTLSLDDALAKAAAAHPDLQAARYERDAAFWQLTEAAGHYLPTGRVEEIYMRSNNPVVAFGTDLNQGTFSLMDFQMSDPNEPDIAEDYITRLSVEQPIFAGGRITSGVVGATHMKAAAEHAVDQAGMNVRFEVERAYLDVLRATRFVDLTKQVVTTMERHRQSAGDAFAGGLVLESEVLQADVYLARARVSQLEAENNRRLAMAKLNYLMGENQDAVWDLAEPAADECAFPATGELIDAAWSRRSDLAGMERRVSAAKSANFGAAGAFLPEIGVRGDYDFHDQEDLFGDQAEDWTVYVAAKWELFSGFRDASRTAKSAAERKVAETRLRQMREGIALETRRYALELESAKRKLDTARTAVTQAT
ncbi:MAG: TolC family protein, partial [Deltaproteobacteria bacterium]|nr:TolC family protein [Deltaproteobacteria bacterium]